MNQISIFLFIFLAILPAAKSYGNTMTANSCDESDVSAKVSVSANGDTVVIPSGTCTWTQTLTISTSITLKGSGNALGASSPTKILQGGAIWPGLISVMASGVRISNIYFDAQNWTATDGQNTRTSISMWGTDGRVDHNVFNRGLAAVQWLGSANGVLDHNQFLTVIIALSRKDVFGAGDGQWLQPIQPGTVNALVIEDNQFIASDENCVTQTNNPMACSYAITHDPSNAGRTTIRHNTFTNSLQELMDGVIDAHGNQAMNTGDPSKDFRGTVMLEIYDNTFNLGNAERAVVQRGGTALVYNNTFTAASGNNPALVALYDDEAWSCELFSYLLNCVNNVPTVNPPWSRQDQVFNSFYWNNTLNGVISNNYGVWGSSLNAIYIQPNRDYWLHAPCDGTAGCSGGKTVWTDPAKPGWAENETWIRSGPNAYYDAAADPSIGYKPLVYPHPTVTAEDGPPPAMPGDVNGDGKVTLADAVMVVKYLVGLVNLDAAQLKAADVSGSGQILIYDAVLIAQYSIQLRTSFPVQSK